MAMCNLTECFFQYTAFQKTVVLFRNKIWLCQKDKTFTTVFTTIDWLKPGWPAEPILLTSTLLIAALWTTLAEAASYTGWAVNNAPKI